MADRTLTACLPAYRTAQDATAFASSQFALDYTYFHWLVSLSKFVPTWRKIWNDAAPWMDIVNHQALSRLARHKRREEGIDDFFSVLMTDKDGTAYNLPWPEVVNEIGAIINAGADTTSIALTQVLYFLIQNPQHLGTLRTELDGALMPDEVVAPYEKIRYVISEALPRQLSM